LSSVEVAAASFGWKMLVLKKKYVRHSVFAAECCRIDSSLVALLLKRRVRLMRCYVVIKKKKKKCKWGVCPGLNKIAAEFGFEQPSPS
jgi:hypothetical protein